MKLVLIYLMCVFINFILIRLMVAIYDKKKKEISDVDKDDLALMMFVPGLNQILLFILIFLCIFEKISVNNKNFKDLLFNPRRKNNKRYWIFENNNRFSKNMFTKEEAENLNKTLIQCSNCINCSNCKSCDNCNNCKSCKNCNLCNNCEDCKGCITCDDCITCKDCIYCDNCDNCNVCDNCEDCKCCVYYSDCEGEINLSN